MKPTIALLALFALVTAGTPAFATSSRVPVRRIPVTVTSRGFEPATIPVGIGESVTLVVTRTTDRTCAKEFVIADRKLRKELPLDRAVSIPFVSRKAGEVRFACGMDMVTGRIVVK